MGALSQNEIDALGVRAEAMVNALGAISAEPDRLVRLFLTPEHRRAADRVAAVDAQGRVGGQPRMRSAPCAAGSKGRAASAC